MAAPFEFVYSTALKKETRSCDCNANSGKVEKEKEWSCNENFAISVNGENTTENGSTSIQIALQRTNVSYSERGMWCKSWLIYLFLLYFR